MQSDEKDDKRTKRRFDDEWYIEKTTDITNIEISEGREKGGKEVLSGPH